MIILREASLKVLRACPIRRSCGSRRFLGWTGIHGLSRYMLDVGRLMKRRWESARKSMLDADRQHGSCSWCTRLQAARQGFRSTSSAPEPRRCLHPGQPVLDCHCPYAASASGSRGGPPTFEPVGRSRSGRAQIGPTRRRETETALHGDRSVEGRGRRSAPDSRGMDQRAAGIDSASSGFLLPAGPRWRGSDLLNRGTQGAPPAR
jgi:hypothetical protein